MRLLKGLCVVALAICMTGLVYAETQSVKISGDLTVRSIMRGDYDLDRHHAETASTRNTLSDDWQTFFMSTTEVQIDADLTDNVSGVIRLINQRDWNVRAKSITENTLYTGGGGFTATDDEFDLNIDLAYIELKEFLYSPLTLKIGRQDIWFGKGFVVGLNQQDPQGTLAANEYTAINSFDSIRATLDYDPWTVDVIGAKIWENDIGSQDDTSLYGINVGYIFDVYNAESEGYWIYKKENTNSWNIKDGNTVHTLGIRGSADPIEHWTVAAETAIQFGQYVGSRNQLERRDRSAWAIDASAECRYFQDMFEWKPTLGVEYIYYSGHKNIADETPNSTGTYTGWDVMYRGKFDSAIREFQGSYYLTGQDNSNVRADMNPSYPDASNSNQHQLIAIASVQPTDSLTVDARYIHFWQQYKTYHVDVNSANEGAKVTDDTYLGAEVDLEFTWDYTEDVSFGLLMAWYFPGNHYWEGSDNVASDIVGSVKLSF